MIDIFHKPACLAFFLLTSITAQAQKHQLGLGMRFSPDGAGINGKYFLDHELAIEMQLNVGGLAFYEGRSTTFAGLVEYHLPLPDPRLRVYFGGGAHAGYWTERERTPESTFIAGVDGIGGISYMPARSPFSFSLDFKPALNYFNDTRYFAHNMFGIAARYWIGKR